VTILQGFFVGDEAGPRPVFLRKQRPEKFLALSPEVLELSTAEVSLIVRLGLFADYRNRVYGSHRRICSLAGVSLRTFYQAREKIWRNCDGGVFLNPHFVSRCSWKLLTLLRSEWLEGGENDDEQQ
jgi:hypothetical protein